MDERMVHLSNTHWSVKEIFMKLSIQAYLFIIALAFISCDRNEKSFDASGSFEAEETIISSEAQGVIQAFNLNEGDALKKDQVIGYIDSTQLYLQKQQITQQINALLSRKPNVSVQLAALQNQLNTAKTERVRIEKLVASDAATTKQLDDINAKIETLQRQINAQRSTLSATVNGMDLDANSLSFRLDQINDLLGKCNITNPVKGTVLAKYVEPFEMTQPGKPLYKIADLSELTLRAYITGDQLPNVKLNQTVNVQTDAGDGTMNTITGEIYWISEKAEFTPKTIQTKSERANLVYAIKVKVVNNGNYKIGMYGELTF